MIKAQHTLSLCVTVRPHTQDLSERRLTESANCSEGLWLWRHFSERSFFGKKTKKREVLTNCLFNGFLTEQQFFGGASQVGGRHVGGLHFQTPTHFSSTRAQHQVDIGAALVNLSQKTRPPKIGLAKIWTATLVRLQSNSCSMQTWVPPSSLSLSLGVTVRPCT